MANNSYASREYLMKGKIGLDELQNELCSLPPSILAFNPCTISLHSILALYSCILSVNSIFALYSYTKFEQ